MICCNPIRAALTAAIISIGLATGCTSVPSIDGSPAAAAVEPGAAATATASTVSVSPPSLPGIAELLAQDRFVPLGVALRRSNLDTLLDELDEFVLVAPIGEAFASSGADIGIEYSMLMNNTQVLEAIMRYHVVSHPSTNPSWRTLNGSAIDVDGSAADTIDRLDGIDVLDRIQVRNGTILVVPRLLLPTSRSLVGSTTVQQLG